MKASENIAAFLNFLRDCDERLEIAHSIQRDTEAETQDILHNIEFGSNTQHELILEGIALKDIRNRRRKAKDQIKVLTPIVEWYSLNGHVIKELERLLGKVRKEEKSTENRIYVERTNIIRKILQESE